MDPKDDPEARIRELERPLADQAYATELGVSSYDAYPPPPPSYGSVPPMPSPYHATPYSQLPRVDRRSRAPWFLIAGVFVVFAVIAVAVIASIGAVWTDVHDALETEGATVTERDDTVTIPGLPDMPDAPVPVAKPGQTVPISGGESTRTVVCEGGSVSISGVRNHVEITGNCAGLSVSGVENVVTVEAADSIVASGVGNQITYESGDPEVNESGLDNTIEMG